MRTKSTARIQPTIEKAVNRPQAAARVGEGVLSMMLCINVQNQRTNFGIHSSLRSCESSVGGADCLLYAGTFGVTRTRRSPFLPDINRLYTKDAGG